MVFFTTSFLTPPGIFFLMARRSPKRVVLPEDTYRELVAFAKSKYGERKWAASRAAAELIKMSLTLLAGGEVKVASVKPPSITFSSLLEMGKDLEAAVEKRKAALGEPGEPQPAPKPVNVFRTHFEGKVSRTFFTGEEKARPEEKPEKWWERVFKERGFITSTLMGPSPFAERLKFLKRKVEEGALLIRLTYISHEKDFLIVKPELWQRFTDTLSRIKSPEQLKLETPLRELYVYLARRGLVRLQPGVGWHLPSPLSGERALKALEEEIPLTGRGETLVVPFEL